MVGFPNFHEVAISTLSAMAVGSSGIFPALILDTSSKLCLNEVGMNCEDFILTMEIAINRWLCFATGSLLGEVFLHLLPESVDNLSLNSSAWALATLTGILLFFATEMIAGFNENVQVFVILNKLLCVKPLKTSNLLGESKTKDPSLIKSEIGLSLPRVRPIIVSWFRPLDI